MLMNLQTPRNPNGVLRVVVFCSDSEPNGQDSDDPVAWLTATYEGAMDIERVYKQTSALHSNRPILDRLLFEINSTPVDLVLVNELRTISSRPDLVWKFVKGCNDSETRVIARCEGIDTDKADWELALHIAALRSRLKMPVRRHLRREKAKQS